MLDNNWGIGNPPFNLHDLLNEVASLMANISISSLPAKELKCAKDLADIFKKFANELVEYITIIDQVLNKYGKMESILKKLNQHSILYFSIYECKKIFSKEEIDDYKRFLTSDTINYIYKDYMKEIYTDDQIKKFPLDFSMLMITTLNKLEVVCMDISSNVAGSQFIYPSLHTLFLKLTQMLYIEIASFNINNVDTMYINIIHVYNLWITQRSKDIFKLKKANKKINKIKTKADNEVNELIHKKPKTV